MVATKRWIISATKLCFLKPGKYLSVITTPYHNCLKCQKYKNIRDGFCCERGLFVGCV